jgi:outer membrane protein TolC
MPRFKNLLWFITFLFSISLSFAHENAIVDHHDPIQADQSLTLARVIDLTLEQHPDSQLTSALEQEADALQQRGNSWLAEAPNISLLYLDDLPGDDSGYREFEAELQLPLWNWGQRSAGQAVAEKAHQTATKQFSALKLKIAGLVRNALWNIALKNNRYEQAKSILTISDKLQAKIKRRVELGDLPGSDLLLAKSEYLQARSSVAKTEAAMMVARKNYTSLTQLSTIPGNFKEPLSLLKNIGENHHYLSAINAAIQRKQAELNWVKSAGAGQTNFSLGGKTEKDDENSDDIESMSVGISIPFGGSAHLAPEIATANIQLTKVIVQRDQLFRNLEKQHHEAKHALKVTQTELKIANELKQIAESHLKITRLSFSVGEINLLDLLKIQARTHNAIAYALDHAIMLQKNIALYNQAVGVIP